MISFIHSEIKQKKFLTVFIMIIKSHRKAFYKKKKKIKLKCINLIYQYIIFIY